MKIFWFGYNGFGQLHPHGPCRFVLSPAAFDVSLFTRNFTGASEGVGIQWISDDRGREGCGSPGARSSDAVVSVDSGSAVSVTFEPSAVLVRDSFQTPSTDITVATSEDLYTARLIQLSWNATFMHTEGGIILEGYQCHRKSQQIVIDHLHDFSPLRDVCMHGDELFCIDKCGDCYALQLEDPESNDCSLIKVTVSDEKQITVPEGQVTLDTSSSSRQEFKFHCLSAGDLLMVAVRECDGLPGSVHRSSDGFTFTSFPQPIGVKLVSCGKEHALMLTSQGLVYSYGLGSRGQLGHGDTAEEETPRTVEALAGVAMVTVSAGGWHSACVSDIGDLYIWGWNESGQLGFPSKHVEEGVPSVTDVGRASSPVLFHMIPELLDLPGGVNVSKVSCGSRHTAAVTCDNRLYTWGWGKYGQLGHGVRKTVDSPKHVEYFHRNKLWVLDVLCGDWNTVVQTQSAPQQQTN